MLYIKKIFVSLILIHLFFLTSCGNSESIDNPLTGKNTDERIIMCLEDTYPEHRFHVITSFDKKKNEGIFADENQIEFKVTNVTYDNIYHFGCRDEYLYTLLNQQDYVKKVDEILSSYGLKLEQGEGSPSTIIQISDNMSTSQLADMVLEVLNCVDIPSVVFPKEQGFSTGEVNYYSVPRWGIFVCDFEDVSLNVMTGTLFYFEDKNQPSSNLAERMEQTIVEMQERNAEIGNYESVEDSNSLDECQGNNVTTDFGSYIIQAGWSENELLSVNNQLVYTQSGGEQQKETSYFVVAFRTNPYEESQHEIFRQEIIRQLNENDNIPQGANIEATGTKTQHEDIVYSFEVSLSDDEIMRIHYIVGNKQHCVIQEMDYNNSEECTSAVEQMIKSFIWN